MVDVHKLVSMEMPNPLVHFQPTRCRIYSLQLDKVGTVRMLFTHRIQNWKLGTLKFRTVSGGLAAEFGY